MPQAFSSKANFYARISIFGGALGLTGLGLAAFMWVRSPNVTHVGEPVQQPIQFSHKHHVADDGIDCRYCHTTVETSAFAGMPTTETCMGCHSQIWAQTSALEPVRLSYQTGRPIQWNRVHDLADFVYFDHSIHVQKGVGCSTCHGQVDEMPLTSKAETMQMSWCLDCHRDPSRYVRPREEVFNMSWRPPSNQDEVGRQLVQQYVIESLMNCSTCHR
jgi:hypothetical protein